MLIILAMLLIMIFQMNLKAMYTVLAAPRALALVVLAWAVGGARAGLTAAALWAVACRRLLAGTLTEAPPMAPSWEAYAALADRAEWVNALAEGEEKETMPRLFDAA